MRRIAAPEDIAGVTVAVEANGGEMRLRKAILQAADQVGTQAAIGFAQAGRYKIVFQQKAITVAGKALHVQAGSFDERAGAAQGVDTPQHTAQAQQLVIIIQIGGVAALARVECKAKRMVFAQGLTLIVHYGWHH